jgi:hypothetical protein
MPSKKNSSGVSMPAQSAPSAPTSKTKRHPKPIWTTPISDLDGLSAAAARGLAVHDIRYIEQLLALRPATAEALGDMVKGLTRAGVTERLVPQARFRLQGPLGARCASALVASGYRNYAEVVETPSATLHGKLADNMRRDAPDEREVEQLQLESARAMMTGLVFIRALDAATGKPLKRSVLAFASPSSAGYTQAVVRRGNKFGRIAPIRIIRGTVRNGLFSSPGYRAAPVALTVGPTEVRFVDILLHKKTGKKRYSVDEFKGERFGLMSPGLVFRAVKIRKLSDLPAIPPFQVGQKSAGGQTMLVSFWRRNRAGLVEVPHLNVPTAELPRSIKPGDIVLRKGRGWRKATVAETDKLHSERAGLPLALYKRLKRKEGA